MSFTPILLEKFMELYEEIGFKKGSILVAEGEYHGYIYFILKGCARSYHKTAGREAINWFALEQEWVGSLYNFQGRVSKETIEFLEDSQCLRFNTEKLKQLQADEKEAAHFQIQLMEEYIVYLEQRIGVLAHREGMERYLHLLETKPEYLQRISVTHLASYLGLSRETLSRLRKKITA